MTTRFYSSTSQPTTLALNATAASTVIEVVSLVGYPSSFPYTLCLDYDTVLRELVEVTSAAGTTLTVTRGVDGTSAIAHSAGATVRHVSSARDFADSRAHENASTGVHGVTGAVVGTTDTQTLANKTLTNPVVTGGTYQDVTVSPSAAANVALTVNAHASQSADQFRINDKDAIKRHYVNSTGTFKHVSKTGNIPAATFDAGASTTASDPVIAVFDSTASQVASISNAGAIESGVKNNENGIIVNSPSGYTGVPFRYFKNSVALFSVLNDGSVSTSGNLSVTGSFTGASNMDTDDWSTYAVTWSASVAPSIGNGTLNGRFVRLGRFIRVHIQLTAGSTTTFGTGNWSFSLPVANRTTGSLDLWSPNCSGFDSSTTNIYIGTGFCNLQSAGAVIQIAHGNASGLAMVWGSTQPITWAQNDVINIDFTYEAAS